MASYLETFNNKHAILPVVHIDGISQTIDDIGIAKDAGCDGVFLINMNGTGFDPLESAYTFARREYPDFWIGLNPLLKQPSAAFMIAPAGLNGIWNDNAMILEDSTEQPFAEAALEARAQRDPNILYFGGVDFKYQQKAINPARVARIAASYMDVVTTSGTATGSAPTAEKVNTMKDALPETPLALASGLNRDNIHLFKRADAFLIASSLHLSKEKEVFDPTKMADFVDKVRSL
jgi:predicted TIM-barrel enzyme